MAVLSERGVDAAFNRRLADLTQAWADRRVVEFRYTPATYDGVDREPRLARVRPYLLQPSLTTHALYLMGLDETRDAMRTFKIERIVDLRVTNDRFDAPDAGDLERVLRRAWDIIGDQDEVTVVLRATAPVKEPALSSPASAHMLPDAIALPVGWAGDAEKELRKIPFFVRGKARRNTERFAQDRGISVITIETLYDAKAHFGR